MFDAISGAVYGPNSNGATGYVAKAVSPYVANQIGTYFKENEAINSIDGGTRSEQGSAAHILAQSILGAAVSYASGNDALTGGVSAGTGEASAPLLSQYLYGIDKPSELTAEQKDTVSAITSALGVGIGATTGSASNAANAANAAETSKVAVEDNALSQRQVDAYVKLIERNRLKNGRKDDYRYVKDVIIPVMADEVYKNTIALDNCLKSGNPNNCLPALQKKFSQVDYKGLLKEAGTSQEAYNQVLIYATRNKDLSSCASGNNINACSNLAEFKRNFEAGILVGAGIGKSLLKPSQSSVKGAASSDNNVGRNNPNYDKARHDKINDRQSGDYLNQQASKNVGKVNSPIDFDGHIFNAEIKRRGVVGGHSTATGNIKVLNITKTPDKNGVYEAKVAISDPNNPGKYLPKTNNSGKATMFPNSWTKDRVKVEVDGAYKNRIVHPDPIKAKKDMWYGLTPSGVAVEGYTKPKTTVYPVYNQ